MLLFCLFFSFSGVFPGFLCWKCINVPVWDVLAFTWVEARLGMYGWCQFSVTEMFTTVAEEEFKFNLHPFQRHQRNARERTPGLRPVPLSSASPCWEVHPGSRHPTVRLRWFILLTASSLRFHQDLKVLIPEWGFSENFPHLVSFPHVEMPFMLSISSFMKSVTPAESIPAWASWSPRHSDPSVPTEAGSPWGQALCLSLSCSREAQCLLQSRDTIKSPPINQREEEGRP